MPKPIARPRVKTAASLSSSSEIQRVLALLRKAHGDGAITAGTKAHPVPRIPTGSFRFDIATLGGIFVNRINMVHGAKHSGKSYISQRIAMAAQQIGAEKGHQVAWIDVEGTYDAVWAGKIGVDNEALLLARPGTGEEAIDVSVALVNTAEISLLVVDSLAALLPMKEQEADADKPLVALQSRLITSLLRKVSSAQIEQAKRGHYVSVLLLNQERTKIGGWSPTGDPISLPGGKALGHFTSLEWKMKNKENMRKTDGGNSESEANDHAFAIEKNKQNAGFRSGDFRLIRANDVVPNLTEGELDDAPFILAHAKSIGAYTGTPNKGYTLEIEGYEPTTAGTMEEMSQILYGDREFMWDVRQHFIALEAKRQGMPDWFCNYLRTGVYAPT